ncbi:MAG: glucose-1-phosphate adenylyltransferase [Anaerolineales bacterium]|nr:glucose-1-phosphate adenylyltransferase [Anaerolineales bacterium]MCB9127471.1 glucose-1-phosphate adenylyltransferase [Ardenticatenales bacterium]MCB9172196.1 glucose-1-phosphate adenylyltransferase [Ardenticatenales bacterium]
MKVAAMILAGGEGSRLTVLSEKRAKPSVPFAGKFRIIDFALSNCVNSGIYDVAVLTQYRPHSLNEHIGIGRPWDLDRSQGGVRLLQPYQGRGNQSWYSGTADAVLQNLNYLDNTRADTVLILSGDHIYKMDYRKMIDYHREKDADLTVAVMEVPLDETDRFGIMTTNQRNRVTEFTEKPKQRDKGTLASMGIYLFRTEMMRERMLMAAQKHEDLDFGHHLIPGMIAECKVYAYPYEGYWVDVGTVQAYWQTSMELLSADSQLQLYDRGWTIHTLSEERPPVKVGPQAVAARSLICNGSVVRGTVEDSVLSPGVYVSPGAIVRNSVVMNDTWIGPGAVLDRVIVDKEVVIGAGAHVGVGDGEADKVPNELLPDKLTTGISVIGKLAHLPNNIRVGRNVLINADVDEDDFAPFGDEVPNGATVASATPTDG